MTLSAEEIVAVTCLVRPANTLGDHNSEPITYPYQRILGVIVGDESVTPQQPVAALLEREILLPKVIVPRLLECARVLQTRRFYNCHRFSRVIAGLLDPNWDYELDGPEPQAHYDPPSLTAEPSRKHHVSMGAIGVVGITFSRGSAFDKGDFILHSVVGLGDGVPESLQVTGASGVLGIVKNKHLLKYYKEHASKRERIALYQVPDGPF